MTCLRITSVFITSAALAIGTSVSAQTTGSQPQFGKGVVLGNGLTLTATLAAARDSMISIDNNSDRRRLGPVLTLIIKNVGKGPLSQNFTSQIDGTGNVEIHYEPLDGGPVQIETGAHELIGGGTGYQSPMKGGGIAVAAGGKCVDQNPVAVYDDRRNRIGISTQICTKPGETDRVRFALARPNRTSRAVVVVKCAGCPADGLRFRAGEQKR